MDAVNQRIERNASGPAKKQGRTAKPAMQIYRPPASRHPAPRSSAAPTTFVATVPGHPQNLRANVPLANGPRKAQPTAVKDDQVSNNNSNKTPLVRRSHTSPLFEDKPSRGSDSRSPKNHLSQESDPKGGSFAAAAQHTSLARQASFTNGVVTTNSAIPTRVSLRRTRSKSPGKALSSSAVELSGRKSPNSRGAPPAKLSPKQLSEAKELLESLALGENPIAVKCIAADFESPESADQLAQLLVRQCIEHEKPSKTVSKLCSLLLDSPAGREFHGGLLVSCQQYLDCRAILHDEHFRYWLNFINFLPDLFAAGGFHYDGELVQIMLQCYDYMLKPPVLETLKIDELESLISCLLNVGHELERECSSGLRVLRDTLRDAFILAAEPWARKMLLLLIELSSCGWKLSTEASEYYFQTASHQTSSSP